MGRVLFTNSFASGFTGTIMDTDKKTFNSQTEKLKYELSDRFINFTTGVIDSGYTPFSLSECKDIIGHLSLEEATALFPKSKNFIKYVEKELSGTADHDLRGEEVPNHLNKIPIGQTFKIAIQTAIDDVDNYFLTKQSVDTFDVKVPHRVYDNELGYVQSSKSIGTQTTQEIVDMFGGVGGFMFGGIWFINDGVKVDIIEAIKTVSRSDRYSNSRDYELYSDILSKKYNENSEQIKLLINELKQARFTNMTACEGFRKLWEMYLND